MAIMRYPFRSPTYSAWRDFDEVTNRLARLFDDVGMRHGNGGIWAPPVSVAETADELIFTAELPGLSEDDVQIEIENEVRFFLTNTLVLGATTRVCSNRFQEHLLRGLLSAITFGFLNNTSLNQSTHCLMVIGPFAGRVEGGNKSFMDMIALGRDLCGFIEELAEQLSKQLGSRYAFTAEEKVP